MRTMLVSRPHLPPRSSDPFAFDCAASLAQPVRWSDPGMSFPSTSQPGSPPDSQLLAGLALAAPAAGLPLDPFAAGPSSLAQPASAPGSANSLPLGASVLGWDDSRSSLDSGVGRCSNAQEA
jgi:hypothetical protein